MSCTICLNEDRTSRVRPCLALHRESPVLGWHLATLNSDLFIPPFSCSHWESCPSSKRSACSQKPLTCHSKLSSTTTTLGNHPTSRSPVRIRSGNTRPTLSWCTMLVWYVPCQLFCSTRTPPAERCLPLPLSFSDRCPTTSLGGWTKTRTP